MNPGDYAVTFACYNQVDYTRQCVNSMIRHGDDLSRLVVVDNRSTDETRRYLETLPLGGCILNQANLGCGVAWNQGALALQSEWTIIINNDVIVSQGWIVNLINSAKQNGLKIISPSLIEGPLDYDFDSFALEASAKMKHAVRSGSSHAVCLAVHHSVWLEIGYFQPIPRLWGYEDMLFFREVGKAGIPCGTTGACWLHHFGSITQLAMKQEQGLSAKDNLGNPYKNYRLLQQSWLDRKLSKIKRIRQQKSWCRQEQAQFGISMLGKRINGNFVWK